VYSLNVPVPADVSRLARGFASELFDATARDRHTLVVKRFDDVGDHVSLARRVRTELAGTPPFALRLTGIEAFDPPTTGRGPVVYLAVESPALLDLHHALCDRFGAIEGLEGDEYAPHVTIARGGDANRLVGRSVEFEWVVDALIVWSARYDEPTERISLPI